ncbi:ABC transporter permease [Echinicola vietnamensis]|uniref:ABC-type transport system, involved in lipoprotein release, permease component n=1 Tax=Echinicola vietnamensis (strain DSM 17526 / LMG 23754 / KMM 6221) TaxID=926556 RepID=L0FXQ9_ECHVK|nr:FtsX-like permease family protein [Echinicola vietnamensis]AGA78699.1 ABC-type transport system, involved in lipoprotein release, permease component [Echinicola vietnamensis DSM 17526]
MNLSYFIAKRISFKRTGGFTGTIHQIAVASIAIGLSILIIAFLILGGFKQVVSDKVFSFTGHYQVHKFTSHNAYENYPSSKDSQFYTSYEDYGYIRHIQDYAYKPGLLKGDEEVQGVVLKGVSEAFDQEAFSTSMVKGRFIQFGKKGEASNEVVLSRNIADKLMLTVGDKVVMYFVQDPPRYRRFDIVGIYETYLEDFDDKIIIGDIQTIRNLNGWENDQVGGFEVFLKDPRLIDTKEEELYEVIDYDLKVDKVTTMFIQIFDWLKLLNNNVYVFLGLILFVAAFNMIAILFILIMERTQMIGLLKAIGSTNRQIRGIFVWNGVRIIGRGMLIGNLIGLGIAWLQDLTHLISLDPANYYMSYVPIQWNWPIVLGLNALILFVTTLVLFIPAMMISNVRPIKAIRFD